MKNSWLIFLNLLSGIAIGQTPQYKNISYMSPNHPEFDQERHVLDIYVPSKIDKKTEVVVFIHGGKWQVGHKNTYRFLGRKFAKHNVVTVTINYRLSPKAASYEAMAMDCAYAVKWVYEHIEEYGGDKERIFLYGHSSGGHLSALITSNDRFFKAAGIVNPVKGCVLLDPFGLNIDNYLDAPEKKDKWMYDIFTKDPAIWKDAAPVNFIKADTAKFLVFIGGNSPAKIQKDAERFYSSVSQKNISIRLTRLYNVGHLAILFQLYYTRHPLYKDFIRFMNT
jgi:acetyl esterase/lipase